jgi:molybdopterin molybdotransferase
MLSVDDARALVLEHAHSLPATSWPLVDALGCALAEAIASDIDLPPFDKALVDGFAVRTPDAVGVPPFRFRVGEEITAGRTPTRPLAHGEAALVMTGAPLPDGADAVVMHEQTEAPESGVVLIREPIKTGQNRLMRGRELRVGEVVLQAGAILDAPMLGLLASVGRESVKIITRPRLNVVATGDELVPAGCVPGPGQIRETNATVVRALATRAGARVGPDFGIAPDEPAGLRAVLERALRDGPDSTPPDVLVVCGGVSAGTKDLVPAALRDLGIRQIFHKVALRPGKPLWFGIGAGPSRTLVFGLPGNPASVLVCFLVFVRPALDVLAGRKPAPAMGLARPLARAFQHRGVRSTYYPARLVGDAPGRLEPLDWAGSADLRTIAMADGFAVFPAGDRDYPVGEPMGFLPLPGPGFDWH